MADGIAGARPRVAAPVIFVRYVLFVVFAGLGNLFSQEAVVRVAPALPLMASVLVGTGVGFVIKYALDKRWIFFDDYESHTEEIRKVIVYGLFSVLTTLIFWAVEIGAWRHWETSFAKYTGAVIGLAIGNLIKYLLDRRFVFGTRT